MSAILTITLNPTVDLDTSAASIAPDRKLRCTRPRFDAGGGGINVSRAINALGGNSTAFVALNGPTGDKVMHLLAAQGIALHPFPAPAETRQSITVTDSSSGAQFRFVLPGPDWAESHVKAALTRIQRAAPEGGITVLSGSQPPGVVADFPARLAAKIARTRARLFLDTSGAALHSLMRAGAAQADLLRMDDLEAEELAGQPLPSRTDTARFAKSLVDQGIARAVIIARGADGNVLATPEGAWVAEAAKVKVVSKVGAGDSFVAGVTLALSRGQSLQQALQLGAACATSAVTTPATDLCRAKDIKRLLPLHPVTRL